MVIRFTTVLPTMVSLPSILTITSTCLDNVLSQSRAGPLCCVKLGTNRYNKEWLSYSMTIYMTIYSQHRLISSRQTDCSCIVQIPISWHVTYPLWILVSSPKRSYDRSAANASSIRHIQDWLCSNMFNRESRTNLLVSVWESGKACYIVWLCTDICKTDCQAPDVECLVVQVACMSFRRSGSDIWGSTNSKQLFVLFVITMWNPVKI